MSLRNCKLEQQLDATDITIRMTKIQNAGNTKCWLRCHSHLIPCWWKCKMAPPFGEKISQSLSKLTIILPHNPIIARLHFYWKELKTHSSSNSHTSSVHSVVSDSLPPHGLQHARLPCPSPTPGDYSNSCPSSRWCHPTISSSLAPFSSCLQSFPASESFPMSQFFASGGQCIEI